MLVLLMSLALQEAPAEKLDLLCTTTPNGGIVRHLFAIDAAAKSYTSVVNDKYKTSGTADLTDTTITLVEDDRKFRTTFTISRTTGDLVFSTGLIDGGVAIKLNGSCSKFSGQRF